MISGTMNNNSVRTISAKVELYNGSTLVNTFTHWDRVKSITIERVGAEGKFFGFGICQKVNIKLIDANRELSITTANSFKVYFNGVNSFPIFYVTETHRDEKTNELSITAYDALYAATAHTVAELEMEDANTYMMSQYIGLSAEVLGLGIDTLDVYEADSFMLEYPQGANFEGTENLRELLDAAAEVCQCIYYVDCNEQLIFRQLKASKVCLGITKDNYFNLDSGDNRRLVAITSTTELGDSVTASLGISGTTQFIRDNPFLELREDVATILDNAINNPQVGGLTIAQFECEWRGNYLLEVGDCITLTAKDGSTITSFLLDDSITYNGGYSQKTRWSYKEDKEETADNPTSLGDALNQTFAKVDKVDKRIELVASETDSNSAAISNLQLDTESIAATVSATKEATEGAIDNLNENVANLTNKVEAQLTSEDLSIAITSALEDGVSKVETSTGFTFNDEGLTISKSNSEMSTQITEDGMVIYQNDDEVLTVDNIGVNAKNLHATTYLIIGNYSRFEDYDRGGESRTGCFWIGG